MNARVFSKLKYFPLTHSNQLRSDFLCVKREAGDVRSGVSLVDARHDEVILVRVRVDDINFILKLIVNSYNKKKTDHSMTYDIILPQKA